MATFVDTNVLLDLARDDPAWATWSLERLEEAAVAGAILADPVVHSELSVRYRRIEEVDAFRGRDRGGVDAAPRLVPGGQGFRSVPRSRRAQDGGAA